MILVHYEDGNTYRLEDNRWANVPKKEEIVALEIITPIGRHFRLEKPKDGKAVFFTQRIGYSMHVGGGIVNQPSAGEQVGMFLDKKGTCELLQVEKNMEVRFRTDLKGLGFNKLSLEMLGIDLDKTFVR